MTGFFANALVRARRGFTLIEIMIAIMIIGILTAVVVPMARRQWEQAKFRTTQQELRNIRMAIETYQVDTGLFPARLRDLLKRPTGDERVAAKWVGPYLPKKEVPRDPWGYPYQYRITEGARNQYELYSYGAGGKGASKADHISVHALD